MKPNIILICVDQMRGDCLGILGHPVIETPNLDMMARNGVLFRRAFSAVPSCIASRAALLTGLSQETHGRVGYQEDIAWNYEHTLPGEFAGAGYHTQCIGKMHVFPVRNLCGFHNVVLHDGRIAYHRKQSQPMNMHWNSCDDYTPWMQQNLGYPADVIDAGLAANSWVARPWPYPEHLHPTNWVVTQSIDFLRRRDPGKPFFMMPSFVRPHAPLDPPSAYFDQYIDQDIPMPPMGDWADKEDADRSGLDTECFRGKVGDRQLKRAMAAYYALITHIDHQIGRLLMALEEYEVLKNTVILFVSDHGEMLGDHNIFRKYLPYSGSASVPLVMYDPGGVLGAGRGLTIDKPVELRDIMPTLLDMAGIEIPGSVEGKSVLPLLRDSGADWREYIHGEHVIGEYSNHYLATGSEKYIWFSQTGAEQYFDIEHDPQELHELSKQEAYRGRVEYWRKTLAKVLEGREEGYSDGQRLIPGREPKITLSHALKS